jgi:hypothetical protein
MYNNLLTLCRRAVYALLGFGLILQGCNHNAPVRGTRPIHIPPPDNNDRTTDTGFPISPPSKDAPPVPDNEKPPVPPPAAAAQHALVVGIDQYRHADGVLTDLQGAVNDAHVLRDALRRAKVQLPDERVLLDAEATRAGFIHAWEDMLEQARPGDTLILTFAGHGGQQTDTAPLDETDNLDETLMFHDFKQPNQGLIKDEELYGLFKQASDYQIVFVADSCHSSGMVRSLVRKVGRSRAGGQWDIPVDAPPPLPTLPTQSDEAKPLEHVTLITAVHSDSLEVAEARFEGKQHGALSWYFAQALDGKADGNQNGRLERDELERFLQEKVSDKMNNLQTPKLRPRADKQVVVTLPSGSTFAPPPTQPNISDIAIVVENASAPSLKHVRLVKSNQTFDLRFVGTNRGTEVFNNTGDKITTLSSNAPNHWQRVVDKERFLRALETQFDMRLKPIRIDLREGDKLHKKGNVLHFSITPGDTWEGLNALTLVNMTGDGELQFLYPLSRYKDSPIVQEFPYNLPPLKVVPPFGGDDLVAVLCAKPATGLHTLLAETQPDIPEPEQIISYFRANQCQVGQYAFFSGH